MFLQRPRAWAPLSRPVSTISGATLFPKCRALTQRPSRPPCRGQAFWPRPRGLPNTVLTQLGNKSVYVSIWPRAGTPLSIPVNTTSGATLFPKCRAVSKRKLFPLMSLSLLLPFIRPFRPVYKKPSKRIRNFIV